MSTSESDTGTITANVNLNAPVNFFHQVHDRFRMAGRISDQSVQYNYLIGGLPVHFCFAGTALVESIIPAFEHLPVPSTDSQKLSICLWDSASTGIPMLPPPWSTEEYGDRGTILGFNNDRIRTSFHVGAGILSMLDCRENVALWWIRDAVNVPYYESGAPLQTILQWFMGMNDRQYVHAAAVGTTDGGVLLAGKGGSGKSTTATACLFSDLRYAGDDYVLLDDNSSVPSVHSLYNSVKLDEAVLNRFPQLLSIARNIPKQNNEKKLIFYHQYFPDNIISSFPVRAIMLPRITHEEKTTIQKVTSSAALSALAPSTIFQLTDAGGDEFRRISNFIRKVPAYALHLGTDLSAIPGVILSFLGKEC
jgi:hypothetical protein